MKSIRTRKLIQRISEQDEEAFNELFNYYYPKLIQISLAFVPNINMAQEVVSDVFYKILKNPALLKKIDDFDNYTFLSIKNQSLTYLKKNKNKHLFNSIEHTDDYLLKDIKNPERSIISDELFQLVNDTVQKLPPKRKVIYQLVKEEGKKYKEVAEIMGISVKTVELQMCNALKELRKTISFYLESKDEKIKPIKKHKILNFLF